MILNWQSFVRNSVIAAIATMILACEDDGPDIDRSQRTYHYGADVADFDQDGLADIVVASRFVGDGVKDQGYVDLYIQDGDAPGTFQRQRLPLPILPTYIKIADLNDDETADIVVTEASNVRPFFIRLLNDETNPGIFSVSPVYSTTKSPNRAEVGDIDQDGFVDIVIAGNSHLVMHRQMADGTFANAEVIGRGRHGAAVEDFNRDTVPDIITIKPNDKEKCYNGPVYGCFPEPDEKLAYYENSMGTPGQYFDISTISADIDPVEIKAVDFDDNDWLDIAAVGHEGWMIIRQKLTQPISFEVLWRGEASASFECCIEVADLNGDDRNDVIIGSGWVDSPNIIYVFLQSTSGSFNRTAYRLPRSSYGGFESLVAADLNNDQLLDLLAGNGELFLFLQDPGEIGEFNMPIQLATHR